MEDIPEHDLRRGEVGTVVERWKDGVYEVEFSDDTEEAYAFVALRSAQLMPLYYRKRDAARNLTSMSEPKTYRPFVFSIVEDDGENVTIEVSEEDYRLDLEAGIDEEATLKPGRYKMKRGGFLARHPELMIDDKKRA